MHFQRINRTNAEKCFGIFENRSGSTVLANYPVCFTTTAASCDGYQAVAPATGQIATFFGIADVDVADAQPALAQTYGYRDSIRIFATGSSGTIGAGSPAGPAAGSNGVNSTGTKDQYGPIVILEAVGASVSSAGGYAKGFIRAL